LTVGKHYRQQQQQQQHAEEEEEVEVEEEKRRKKVVWIWHGAMPCRASGAGGVDGKGWTFGHFGDAQR